MHDYIDEPHAIGSPPRAFTLAMKMLQDAGAKRVLDCPVGEGPFSSLLDFDAALLVCDRDHLPLTTGKRLIPGLF